MKRRINGATRFWLSAATGVAVGAVTWLVSGRWPVALLLVVIITATVCAGWALRVQWPLDAEQTRAYAGQADVDDEVGDLVILLILAASLGAIGILLASANDRDKVTYASLALIAIFGSWALLHTMYVARYARIYYQDAPGGIDFNSDVPPRYADFYYFSFNLGMTYQVSDTSVGSSRIRAEVLRHCLFSYIYGTVIIACTINLVINLVG